MKKVKVILITVFILFTLIIPSQVVLAADDTKTNTEMIPSIEKLYDYKNNKYFNVYKDNYYLDMKETGIFKAWGGRIFNMAANALFGLEVTLSKIVITVVYYAFSLSFFDIFSPFINSLVQNLQVGIFDELSSICIACIGIFYVIKMAKNQKTQVIKAIVQVLAVLVFALLFFHSPTSILNGVDTLSKTVGQAALEGTFKATNNGQNPSSATEAVSTNLWLMFVHKPWEIFEFENTEFAAKNEDKILKLPPESDERQSIVNEMAKDKVHFQPRLGLIRFGLTLVYLIICIIVSIFILILCGLMIGYQFLMILFAMFAPLVFLLALLPHFGFNTLKSWGSKVIGYGSMKAVLSLAIAIVFSFMLALYKLSDKYGLVMIGLIMVTCLWIIWFKREELFDFYVKFATAARQPNNPTAINNMIRKDTSLENGFRGWVAKKREDRNNDSLQTDDSQPRKYDDTYGSYSSEIKRNTAPRGIKSTYYSGQGQQHENTESINAINNNLNGLLKIAQEVLDEKYEKSKSDSELIAKETGNEPQYSPWVKRVKSREDMNLPKFDEREKLAMANRIKDITANGGNVNELLEKDGFSNENIRRPEGVVQSEEVVKPVELKIENEPSLSDNEASSAFAEHFNSEYGKNYSPKFMGNLIDKYGQKNVRNVLDQMQRINSKNEKIQNPAGYLTKSLKNNLINNEVEDFNDEGFKYEAYEKQKNPEVIYDFNKADKSLEKEKSLPSMNNVSQASEHLNNLTNNELDNSQEDSFNYEVHKDQKGQEVIFDSEYSNKLSRVDLDSNVNMQDESFNPKSIENNIASANEEKYVAYDSEQPEKKKKIKADIKKQVGTPQSTHELNLKGGVFEYNGSEKSGEEKKQR